MLGVVRRRASRTDLLPSATRLAPPRPRSDFEEDGKLEEVVDMRFNHNEQKRQGACGRNEGPLAVLAVHR